MRIATGNYAKPEIGRFEKCPICKSYGYFGGNFSQHKCKPAFYCKLDDPCDKRYWKTFADSASDAAERFVHNWDSSGGEYDIAYEGKEVKVIVAECRDYDRISDAEEELEYSQDHLRSLQEILDEQLDEADREHLASLPGDIAALQKELIHLRAIFKTFIVTGEIVPSYTAEEVRS